MRNLKLNLFFIASLALLFTACSKEGPAGPAGATGAAGPQGPQGPTGPQGPAGTANVIYSSWVATTAADWTVAYAPPYWALYGYNRTATGLTQTIIDNGVILCYIKNWTYFDDVTVGPLKSAVVAQLPFIADPDFGDFYDFVIPAPGTIKFLYKSQQQTWSNTELAGTSFRYVLIPGGVSGGRGVNVTYEGYTADELKKMPYEDVARIFKIPVEGTNIH